MIRSSVLFALILLPLSSRTADAQSLTPPASPGTWAQANLHISGKAGSKSVQATGMGSCRHAPEASIGGLSASLWMVQYGGDGQVKQLNLTLWRPKDGSPDQLSLSMEAKSGEHRIETGAAGESQGEGSVTILPNGPGGRLELRGKDSQGKPLQITIDCPTFGGVQAEGG